MLKIGVTGHRFLSHIEVIESGVDQVLKKFQDDYPEEQWVIYSSLAQGADCIVAEKILSQVPAKLIVPLPLPAPQYLRDFTSLRSRQVFERLAQHAEQIVLMPPQPSRAHTYLEAGKYILANCDVLIAVWNGKAAQGLGGTGDIIHLAREQGMPIAWIRAGNRRPGTTIPTTLEQQGIVSYEGFSAP